jgi:hypothetical protein
LGRIRELQSGRRFTLEAYTRVGRAGPGGLALTDRCVSNEHACLKWKGNGWSIRDLGSTNGTWLNDQPLAPGVDVAVAEGDRIAFAERDQSWELEDASAPAAMACPLGGGEPCVLVDGIITLPNAESAVATIFRGADGHWTLETASESRTLPLDGLFDAAGQTWRFSYPDDTKTTAKARKLRLVQECVLHFEVSRDQEYVSLYVDSDGDHINMGQLSGFYLLMTLAQVRVKEASDLPPTESGWVHREDLMRMLQCGEQQLNVWVHRVRSRFSNKEFLDYASIVERRDGSGQMRIGVDRDAIRGCGAR